MRQLAATVLRWTKANTKIVTAVFITAVVTGLGTAAYASIPDVDGTIHGCRDNTTGALRVIESGSCSGGETALNWNKGEFLEDLVNADFYGASIWYRDFGGRNLTGATFTSSVMSGNSFKNTNLTNASLVMVNGRKLDFTGADLTGAQLYQASFRDSNFSNVDFGTAAIYGNDFRGSDLSDTVLNSVSFMGYSNFSNGDAQTNLDNADLSGLDIAYNDFTGTDLSTANVTGATWTSTTCPDGTYSDNNEGGTCVGHLEPVTP
jgi:uncharacterized protein YjbI with pentapeptide repeats